MNNKKRKFQRSGRIAEISQLTFHDWFGNLIDRVRSKTTEKGKGLLMMDLIEKRFSISDFDKEEWRKEMKIKEAQDFEEMKKQTAERKSQDPFTRDEHGNIISPFKSEKIKW